MSGRNSNGCEEYGNKKYCKKGGDHYGENWNRKKWGKFEDWADDQGRTALVCPQCGCVLAKFGDVFCFTHFLSGFLDASSHLYKRVCPSVGPLVRPLGKCKNRVSQLLLAAVRS